MDAYRPPAPCDDLDLSSGMPTICAGEGMIIQALSSWT